MQLPQFAESWYVKIDCPYYTANIFHNKHNQGVR